MATTETARQQLSKDVGDFFTGTTTETGAAAGATLVDTSLEDFKDDDLFNPFSNVTFLPTSGTDSGNERAATSKTTKTVTMRRAFTAQIATSVTYEMHRLFTASEKDEAVTEAISLVFPMVWVPKTAEVTIVDDQFDYDITGSGFLNDTPHQIHIVSNDDTEITRPFYDWEIRFNTSAQSRLHLLSRLNTGDTIRLFGIVAPAIADFSGTDLLILTAQAAVYLFETNIANAMRDDTTRMEQGVRQAEKLLARRVTRSMKMVPFPRHMRTVAYRQSASDINFRVK